MSKFSEKYKSIIKDLEDNIKDKDDLEYIKEKLSVLFMDFLNEIESITDMCDAKLKEIEQKQKQLEEKATRLEESVQKMENDIYLTDNYDFEIVCPYCNYEFVTEFDELKKEIKCPECNNTIELDWNEEEEEGCAGNCACCHGECEENDDDSQEENDDDM